MIDNVNKNTFDFYFYSSFIFTNVESKTFDLCIQGVPNLFCLRILFILNIFLRVKIGKRLNKHIIVEFQLLID